MFFNLVGALLCMFSAVSAAANFCNPCRNDCCCEWSCCDGKFTFGADWIYWKVTEDNLDPFVVTDTVSSVTDTSFNVHNHVKHFNKDFKYTSGFSVNLGYEMPCDCWGVNVIYTYLPSNVKSKVFHDESSPTNFLVPNLTDFPILTSALSGLVSPTLVSSKWNLTANNIDVDIGRCLCFGECVKLRPHIGFRATWFDQKLNFRSNSFLIDDDFTSDVAIDAKWKERFRGYGIEGGLWGEWKIACGFSFVGHFGGAILYSKIRTIDHLAVVSLAGPTSSPPIEGLVRACGSRTVWTGTPMMDYFVGLQYADCMCDMPIAARIGWESHVLFDVNRLGRDGNLVAQGLTLGFEVGF